MEQMEYNLMFRWFVGLGIDDPVSVPTVFSKNRDRRLPPEPPRVYRRVVCSMTKRPYRMSSGLHRTPPMLVRVGCSRWSRGGGGCYTNRPVSR